MSYHNYRNAVLFIEMTYQLIHILGHKRVKTCCRLIEEQKSVRCTQCPCEQNSLLLAARKLVERLVLYGIYLHDIHVFLSDSPVLGRVKKLPFSAESAAEDNLLNAGWEILLNLCFLRQITNLAFLYSVKIYATFGNFLQTENTFQKCTFSCSVLADDAKEIALINGEADAVDRPGRIIIHMNIFAFQKLHQFSASFKLL